MGDHFPATAHALITRWLQWKLHASENAINNSITKILQKKFERKQKLRYIAKNATDNYNHRSERLSLFCHSP